MKNLFKLIFSVWYRNRFQHFGSNSWISPRGCFLLPDRISIGDNVYIGPGAYISCNQGLTIGNGVTVGPKLLIMGGDHNFRIVGKAIHEIEYGGINAPVKIEDDVWIGARVTMSIPGQNGH